MRSTDLLRFVRDAATGNPLRTSLLASLVAILTTFGIVLSLLFESIRFFSLVPATELLFGTIWNPQSGAAMNADSSTMRSPERMGAVSGSSNVFMITWV